MVSQDKDAVAAIMAYINMDHQDSLIRYLQYYAHLSAFSARNAHLSALTLSSLTIRASPRKTHTIPLRPPMTSWSDIRARVVAMDAEATTALRHSSITVKRYTPPRGFVMTAVLASIVLMMPFFSYKANFLPGSVVYDTLLKDVPHFADFCLKYRLFVISSTVIIHAGEAIHMQRNKLEKHTVKMLSGVWWMWLISSFVEGIGSFYRFAEVVREEEAKKQHTGSVS